MRWGLPGLLLLIAGCSTVYDASGRTPLGPGGPHVYGGTRTIFRGGGFVGDYWGGCGDSKGSSSSYLNWSPNLDGKGALVLIAAIVAVVVGPVVTDLAFSFFADTLLLPGTLTRSRKRAEPPPETAR